MVAFALVTFTGPPVEETMPMMRKAVLPARMMPFCPMMSGFVPRLISVKVCCA